MVGTSDFDCRGLSAAGKAESSMTSWGKFRWWLRFHRRQAAIAGAGTSIVVGALVALVAATVLDGNTRSTVTVHTASPTTAITDSTTVPPTVNTTVSPTTVPSTSVPATTVPAATSTQAQPRSPVTTLAPVSQVPSPPSAKTLPTPAPATTAPPHPSISGSVTVHEQGGMPVSDPNADCSKTPGFMGGYPQTYQGVTIRDSSGKALVLAPYTTGRYVNLHPTPYGTYSDCQLPYQSSALPTEPSYELQVGENISGDTTEYTYSELAAAQWTKNFMVSDGSGWGPTG